MLAVWLLLLESRRRSQDLVFVTWSYACKNGHVEVIKALLEAGADLNHAANNGLTPLVVARAENEEGAAQALVQASATE